MSAKIRNNELPVSPKTRLPVLSAPVAAEKDLIRRLTSEIRRLEIQSAHEPDAAVKAKMETEAARCRERLGKIER